MRTEESSKNAMTSVVFYILDSIFGFLSKTVIIYYLGIEYSGLNSLLSNILGILNIAELGISTAVGYSLYKPLLENDTKTINEILKLFKYLYRIVAIVILVIGLIITIFLPCFITTTIDMTQIRISYVLYLLSTVVSYLFTFLTVLPTADQKNYVVTKIQGIFKIIKYIIQFVVIIIFKNYYIWLIIEIFGNMLMYIYTNFIIRKKYTYYQNIDNITFKDLTKKYKQVITSTRDLFFHKIGALAVNQTDNIVISYFCTLTDVGIYGNYMLVYKLLTGTIDQAFGSITASIGNLIIEKGKKESLKIFKEIYTIMILVTVVIGFLFYKLANQFITVWVGEEYIVSTTIVFAIAINIMFRIIKQPLEKFKEAFGIFGDKLAPVSEAIINFVISIVLAMKIGMLGVVIGTVASNIIITGVWKPYVVYKYGFEEKFKEFIKLNIPLIVLAIVAITISNAIINAEHFIGTSWIGFIIAGIVYSAITGIIGLGLFMIYKPFRQTFMKYIKKFINIFKKRIGNI